MRKWLGAGAVLALGASVATVAVVVVGRALGDEPSRRVALVVSSTGVRPTGASALMVEGLEKARRELGVRADVAVSRSAADRVRDLEAAARHGASVVIAGGIGMEAAVAEVAPRYPRSRFAIVGTPAASVPVRAANVRGIVIAGRDIGYLAGAAAALGTTTRIVSVVAVRGGTGSADFVTGFRAGAREAVPGTTVRVGWTELPRCRAVAIGQLTAGSGAVAGVPEPCAVVALTAAREKRRWGVGLDSGPAVRGRYVLTSIVELPDVAVFRAVESVVADTFPDVGDFVMDARSGAIGLGPFSPAAPSVIAARLASFAAAMKAGRLVPPTR